MHYAYLHGSQAIKKRISKHLLLYTSFPQPSSCFLLFASNMYYDIWIRNIKVKRTVTEQGKTFYIQPFKILFLLEVFSLILSHLEQGGTKEWVL